MDTNKSSGKNNLIKMVLFFVVSLLSILLIMVAVSMLDLPAPDAVENNNTSSNADDIKNNEDVKNQGVENQDMEGQGDNPKEQDSIGDSSSHQEQDFESDNQHGNIEKQFSDWKEWAKERKDSIFNPFEEESYAQEEQNESFLPGEGKISDDFFKNTPNIDISGKQDAFGSLYGDGGMGSSIITSEEKSEHIPVFEVLGESNYPFLKVIVMDNYYKNRWLPASEEEPELKLMIGVEMEKEFSKDSVKIKPIEPSSGNLPVLSGNFELKYFHALLKYKNTGTYVAENIVENFYEMQYSTPPTKEMLKHAQIDDSYSYKLSYSKKLASLLDIIIKNSNSDYEAIKFVEEYLLQNYILDNSIINNYGDKDGIDSFLFGEIGVGNRLDFLSSYTFILKALGIPCRLVVGYEIDDTKPYQIVYGDQRCIYSEVKFEDYGWVPMDVFGRCPFYTPPETTQTEITYADPIAKRGTSFNVRGTVEDSYGRLLDGLQVLIYVKEDKDGPYLSYARANVQNGYFEVECDVQEQTGPGNYHVIAELLENDLYKTSSSDPDLKIMADTHLELSSKDVAMGNRFKLEGRITDAFSNEGLKEFPITIEFKDLDISEEMYSMEGGEFDGLIELDIPKNFPPEKKMLFVRKYSLSFEVKFYGTEYYYPSSVEVDLQVWKPMPLGILIVVILLLLLVLTVVLLLKKTKSVSALEKQQVALAGVKAAVAMSSNNNITIKKKSEILGIFIEFPYIKKEFPNVWGIGEKFLIRFTDNKGNFSEKQAIFHERGKYAINILKDGTVLISRQIKVVIYREEIIFLGKNFLKNVLQEDLEITATMTLREIYSFLESKIAEKRYKVLKGIFFILEKAVYSEEAIGRNDYEMLLTIIEKYKKI